MTYRPGRRASACGTCDAHLSPSRERLVEQQPAAPAHAKRTSPHCRASTSPAGTRGARHVGDKRPREGLPIRRPTRGIRPYTHQRHLDRVADSGAYWAGSALISSFGASESGLAGQSVPGRSLGGDDDGAPNHFRPAGRCQISQFACDAVNRGLPRYADLSGEGVRTPHHGLRRT